MRKFFAVLALAAVSSASAALSCPSGAKCIEVVPASFSGEGELVRSVSGARFLRAPEPVAPPVPLAAVLNDRIIEAPLYEVGDVLPRGRYSMLINSAYFGLPPAPEGTLYFEVGAQVFLVDRNSFEILQNVSRDLAANF